MQYFHNVFSDIGLNTKKFPLLEKETEYLGKARLGAD